MKTSYLLGTPARLETRVSNCQENRLPTRQNEGESSP